MSTEQDGVAGLQRRGGGHRQLFTQGRSLCAAIKSEVLNSNSFYLCSRVDPE